MKFSHEKPPIYEQCKKEFGIDWESIVITYGDTVYSKHPLSEDLKAHEKVHIEQQTTMGKEIWWDKYFADPDFRLSQEVPAYKAQLEFAKNNYNRAGRRRSEKHIYYSMAHFYGNMCRSEEEAKELLQ